MLCTPTCVINVAVGWTERNLCTQIGTELRPLSAAGLGIGRHGKGATLGVVAVHKKPVPVDFLSIMSNEITLVGSIGYPTEIFSVTADLVANWQKYALIISHTIDFADLDDALTLAGDTGAADKIIITMN